MKSNKQLLLLLLTFLILIFVLLFFYLFDLNSKQLLKIKKDSSYFCFAVLGDTRDNPKVFGEIINSINKDHNVSFTIILGDLVNRGDPISFILFILQYSKFQKPVLVAIGNHDLFLGNSFFYNSFFGPNYYSFKVGKSYFIILDASNEERFDEQEERWLIAELNKSKNFTNRFVFMHVPLFDPRCGDKKVGHSFKDKEEAERLLTLFKKYNVSFIFASHIHGYFNGTWDGIPYIITGGGGAPLHGEGENYFYHWIKVCVDQNKFYFDVIKVMSS